MSLARSVLAVVAGVAVLTVTSFGIEALVKPWWNDRFVPGSWLWLLATYSYTLPCVALGAFVAAWIAKHAAVKHALAYAGVMALLTAMVWASPPPDVPHQSAAKWLLGIALLFPASWLGGAFCQRRARHG